MGGSLYDVVILGEPASAKNQRRIVKIRGQTRLIKSSKALKYTKSFKDQAPVLDPLLEGDLSLRVDVWYASRRPDSRMRRSDSRSPSNKAVTT